MYIYIFSGNRQLIDPTSTDEATMCPTLTSRPEPPLLLPQTFPLQIGLLIYRKLIVYSTVKTVLHQFKPNAVLRVTAPLIFVLSN